LKIQRERHREESGVEEANKVKSPVVHIEYTTRVKSEWRRRRRKIIKKVEVRSEHMKTPYHSSLSLPPSSIEVKVTIRSNNRIEEYKS
jgi:hypothetical protein